MAPDPYPCPVSPRTSHSPGVVAAAFPEAAEAGVAMLRLGGNAIDAACAAAWALCVCEPGESGLGGQTTMLIRLDDGRCTAVDGHSHAPVGLRRKRVGRRSQRRGIRATTVPSTPATLEAAQRRYGRLSLTQAIGPAARIAEEGYRITKLQRRLARWSAPYFEPGSCEARTFLGADGGAPAVGDVLRQPALAATLRLIAERGVEDFYTGEIAREISSDMEARGGLVTLEDLRTLGLPVEREPLAIGYRGRRVISAPPPSGGVQTLLALRILAETLGDARDPEPWRVRVAEATLGAFRERERWPDHPADMTPTLAKWLVSTERAERLAPALRERTEPPAPPDSLGESGNTTHLCAADAEGVVVSLTQSIQSVFGAKVMHPRLGFVYNNYLSTCPRTPHPYRLGAGCLPQSNASPTLVLGPTGTPELALGSAGSRRITSSVVQVISAVLDRGCALEAAVAAPRAHALLSGALWLESSMDGAGARALEKRFPRTRRLPAHSYKLGAVQAISWDEGGRATGVADPRRDGAVAYA